MCRNVLVVVFGGDTCICLEDIARKREGGLEIAPPPPVGRGLTHQLVRWSLWQL